MQNVNLVPVGVARRVLFPRGRSYLSSLLAIDALGFVEDDLNHECYRLISNLTLVFEGYSGIDQRLAAAQDLADHVALGAPSFDQASNSDSTAQLLKLLRFRADGIARQRAHSEVPAMAPTAVAVDHVYRSVWATYSLKQKLPALNTTTSYQITFTPQKETTVSKTLTTLDINRCLGSLPLQLADWSGAGDWLGSSFINYCFAVFDDHTPDDVDFRSSEWMQFALTGRVPRRNPLPQHRITIVPLNTPIPPTGQAFDQQPGSLSGKHWTCLEINHQGKTFTIHDSLYEPKAAQNARVSTTLTQVLGGTWAHLPQRFPLKQRNGSDCGVYTIINAWLIGCIGRTLSASEFMVDTFMWRALLATMALGAEDSTKRYPPSAAAPPLVSAEAPRPPAPAPGPTGLQPKPALETAPSRPSLEETPTKPIGQLQFTAPLKPGQTTGQLFLTPPTKEKGPGKRLSPFGASSPAKNLRRNSPSLPSGHSSREVIDLMDDSDGDGRVEIDLVDDSDPDERVVIDLVDDSDPDGPQRASRERKIKIDRQIAQDARLARAIEREERGGSDNEAGDPEAST